MVVKLEIKGVNVKQHFNKWHIAFSFLLITGCSSSEVYNPENYLNNAKMKDHCIKKLDKLSMQRYLRNTPDCYVYYVVNQSPKEQWTRDRIYDLYHGENQIQFGGRNYAVANPDETEIVNGTRS